MIKNEFYNELSKSYDDMIDFENALQRRKEILNPTAKGKSRALDFGCGTGIDSIALAKLGLQVDALDISEEMISVAKKNCSVQQVNVTFGLSYELKKLRDKNYDLIVSLGNTLANIDSYKINMISKEFQRLIKPGGLIVFQIINFSQFVPGSKYVINLMENENLLIERYYLVSEYKIEFCIRKINKQNNEESLISTNLFPHSPDLFTRIFNLPGYKIEYFGDLKFGHFDPRDSKDLVIKISRT